MNKKWIFSALLLLSPLSSTVSAHMIAPQGNVEALADIRLLQALKIPILAKSNSGVAYAVLTPKMQEDVVALNHRYGRCGGFEALPPNRNPGIAPRFNELAFLDQHVARDRRWAQFSPRNFRMAANPAIEKALGELREENLQALVTWISSFPTRYNKSPQANVPVMALAERLRAMLASSQIPAQVDLIDHRNTPQKSVRVRLLGKLRPQEVVVLGAHFDSINQWGGSGGAAPGADDNASGSSNIIETLRVFLQQGQPARTVDFYWYAGEESGLLGSAEIARSAKEQNAKIMAVLQLDMTLFPGSGEFVLGSMTDFTSAWLRDFLVAMNNTYLKARIIDDACGYGCSDHASWYRQGYPTLMPFEATFRQSNGDIHTAKDVISNKSSFRHSLMFSKIALIFAMEIANSDMAQPY